MYYRLNPNDLRIYENLAGITEITTTLDTVHRFGPGWIRLPIPTGLFLTITSVGLTFNGTGAGWTWENLDKVITPGPQVKMYKGNTELADATIDAVIRGF